MKMKSNEAVTVIHAFADDTTGILNVGTGLFSEAWKTMQNKDVAPDLRPEQYRKIISKLLKELEEEEQC